MNQNEQDLQGFIQIRDEIHEEIKKIAPNVLNLQNAIKGVAAQGDVLKKLSETVQEHIKTALNEAAQDLAFTASEALASKIEEKIQEILHPLEHSIQQARRALEVSKGAKYRKLLLCAALGCFLCGGIGTGVGYVYAKRHTYVLPEDFITMYALGREYKETLSKKHLQNDKRAKKTMTKDS